MLAAILVVAVLIGVGLWVAISSNGNEEGEVTLKDALGRDVIIEERPENLISISPALTEMIYAIGSGDDLIGVTSYCDYPEDVLERKESGDLTVIGGFWEGIDIELIISMDPQPDLVFLEESVPDHLTIIQKLTEAKIDVVVMFQGVDSEAIKNNFELLGKALFEEEKGVALGESMDRKFDAIADKVAGSTVQPKVMMVIWWDSTSIMVAGGGNFIDEIIVKAGAINAFGDRDEYAYVTEDDILAEDPDIIIVTRMYGNLEVALDALNNGTALEDVSAVKEGRIFIALDQAENAYLRQGMRIVDATYLTAMIAHPESFEETLPNSFGNEYKEYLPTTW